VNVMVVLSPSQYQDNIAFFVIRLHGLRELSYGESLSVLNLQSLELRRLQYDLHWCYKILFGLVCVNSDEFFKLSATNARGHPYKLHKQRSYHSARLYFFSERIINIWNDAWAASYDGLMPPLAACHCNSCVLSMLCTW